jgi:HEAT repeat protein
MRVRTCFVVLLGLLTCSGCGRKKSIDELIGDLHSEQERDRITAVRLLPNRKADTAKVVPAMIASLKDSDSDVRRSAAIALGVYGEEAKDAIPALQEAQRDSDARIREAAGIALSRIDPTLEVKSAPAKGKNAAKTSAAKTRKK